MTKERICSNCVWHTIRADSPRCTKGLNPALGYGSLHSWPPSDQLDTVQQMAQFCDSYVWCPERFPKLKRITLMGVKRDPRWTTAELPEKFVPYYESNHMTRIKVEWGTNWTRTECGFVSISTGWSPVFLLMRSIKSKGSSTVLSNDYRIIGVKYDGERRYREVV